MPTFNRARLILARERRGLFSKELAERCGLSPQTISNWESGVIAAPLPEALATVAKELDFPESFFFRDHYDRLPEGAVSFRARSKMPARQKRAALAASDLAREFVDWLEAKFELPPVRLPDLHGHSPELVAQVLRTEWLLGEKPIPNIIHLLESRGVLVLSLAQDCRDLDAFSFKSNGRPIVLLNRMKTAERSRIDAAHELFHLVAHKEETGKEEEADADAFAGAFLMPENDLRRRIPRVVGLNQLIQEKGRWGVSLAALVYRLRRVEIATEWQYRALFIELSKRGFRSAEPNSMPRDSSALLSKVFESLRARGVGVRHIAADLNWSVDHLKEFLLGLGAAFIGFDGGGEGGGGGARNRLRLV